MVIHLFDPEGYILQKVSNYLFLGNGVKIWRSDSDWKKNIL